MSRCVCFQILKPSEKKAKYQYGGMNSGRPVTPPRTAQTPKKRWRIREVGERESSVLNVLVLASQPHNTADEKTEEHDCFLKTLSSVFHLTLSFSYLPLNWSPHTHTHTRSSSLLPFFCVTFKKKVWMDEEKIANNECRSVAYRSVFFVCPLLFFRMREWQLIATAPYFPPSVQTRQVSVTTAGFSINNTGNKPAWTFCVLLPLIVACIFVVKTSLFLI